MQSIDFETAIISLDLSSWEKRHKVVTLVVGLLELILLKEKFCVARLPLVPQPSNAYTPAELSCDLLDKAIDILCCVYGYDYDSIQCINRKWGLNYYDSKFATR